MNCVVSFVDVKLKKNRFPRISTASASPVVSRVYPEEPLELGVPRPGFNIWAI